MAKTLYDVLDVPQNAPFSELKRAYYRCAKICHPDLHGNSPEMTRRFQEIVAAFDVLSDAVRRHEYDLTIGVADAAAGAVSRNHRPIMDRESDEILEELVVGNELPGTATLATLLADLAGTELFLTYREGKDHQLHRRTVAAEFCFREVVRKSPNNIVFRACYARVLYERKHYAAALKQYRAALAIGRSRRPPLLLKILKNESEELMRRHLPVRYFFHRLRVKPEYQPIPDAADEMLSALNRAFARSLSEESRKLIENREEK